MAHPAPVDFEKEVLPILASNCLACHNKTKAKAGLILETPADMLKGGDTGPAIVAGKPEASLLLKAIRYTDDTLKMPPKSKLPASAVADIEKRTLSLTGRGIHCAASSLA